MSIQFDARISVRITPSARRNAVTAFADGVWYLKIAAPPVEGKANDKLIEYLSQILDVRKSNLSIIKGQTGKNKLVGISDLSQTDITSRLTSAID